MVTARAARVSLAASLALGNAALFAESPLVLTGFRTGISGQAWTVTRVEHSFSAAGFTSRVSGEVKQA